MTPSLRIFETYLKNTILLLYIEALYVKVHFGTKSLINFDVHLNKSKFKQCAVKIKFGQPQTISIELVESLDCSCSWYRNETVLVDLLYLKYYYFFMSASKNLNSCHFQFHKCIFIYLLINGFAVQTR